MRKYFGTDGIRGEANRELTANLAMKLGYALGYYLKKENRDKKKIKVIMGTDTRISGYMLRSALTAGLTSMGINIDFVGVLPTPGVAYITQTKGAAAGIMISASHNPAKDNGIKIFGSDGCKLLDKIEQEIEKYMNEIDDIIKEALPGDKVGKFKYAQDDYFLYRDHLKSIVKEDFSGMKIIIDAANGSAYRVAKEVFLSLGAEIVVINDAPNGKNINVNCGSTNPEILSKVVIGYNADLGLAYDGDADRLIAVDEKGEIIDGDKIIAVLALEMKKNNNLNGNKVVTTVMSNMGFESYLNEKGVVLVRANVGDRYVLEKMKSQALNLGGEKSGHIILLEYGTTGDGVQTSLKLVELLRDSKKTLGEMAAEIPEWPQELINLNVGDNDKKNLWKKNEEILKQIEIKEKELGNEGRILVRTSGTEPIVRIMVEGKDSKKVLETANFLSKVIGQQLK